MHVFHANMQELNLRTEENPREIFYAKVEQLALLENDFDIFAVPSVRLIIRAPCFTIIASGSVKVGNEGIPAALHRFLKGPPLQY